MYIDIDKTRILHAHAHVDVFVGEHVHVCTFMCVRNVYVHIHP